MDIYIYIYGYIYIYICMEIHGMSFGKHLKNLPWRSAELPLGQRIIRPAVANEGIGFSKPSSPWELSKLETGIEKEFQSVPHNKLKYIIYIQQWRSIFKNQGCDMKQNVGCMYDVWCMKCAPMIHEKWLMIYEMIPVVLGPFRGGSFEKMTWL